MQELICFGYFIIFVGPYLNLMKQLHIKTILMIDDDPDDCLLLSQAIKEVFSEITLLIMEGCSLINNMSNFKPVPDCIFLDLNMPVLNGFECMDMIRLNKQFDNTPIFIYSTSSDISQIRQCYLKGAQLYIQKPSSFSKIKEIIRKISVINISDLKEHQIHCKIFTG